MSAKPPVSLAVPRRRQSAVADDLDPLIQRLIDERLARGLSQRDVVRAISSSSASVSSWERGIQSPSLYHLRRWAAALGLEPVLSSGQTAD